MWFDEDSSKSGKENQTSRLSPRGVRVTREDAIIRNWTFSWHRQPILHLPTVSSAICFGSWCLVHSRFRRAFEIRSTVAWKVTVGVWGILFPVPVAYMCSALAYDRLLSEPSRPLHQDGTQFLVNGGLGIVASGVAGGFIGFREEWKLVKATQARASNRDVIRTFRRMAAIATTSFTAKEFCALLMAHVIAIYLYNSLTRYCRDEIFEKADQLPELRKELLSAEPEFGSNFVTKAYFNFAVKVMNLFSEEGRVKNKHDSVVEEYLKD